MEVDNIWTTAFGEQIKFSELEHQHLSNILWFKEVFNNCNRYNDNTFKLLSLELYKRFNDEQLLWLPLPVPNELRVLKNMGLLNGKGEIKFTGSVIGSITHIPKWEKYI